VGVKDSKDISKELKLTLSEEVNLSKPLILQPCFTRVSNGENVKY
jgi:hypothetical protein